MSKHIIPIDASKLPDLLKVAEEVNMTKIPRLIKRNGETLAMLMPTGKKTPHPQKRTIWTRYNPEEVRAALKESAGALRGVDTKELSRDLAEQRSQESTGRPL